MMHSGIVLVCSECVGGRAIKAPKHQTYYSGSTDTCKRLLNESLFGKEESSFFYATWLRVLLEVHFCTGFGARLQLWCCTPLWRWHATRDIWVNCTTECAISLIASIERSHPNFRGDDATTDPQWSSILFNDINVSIKPLFIVVSVRFIRFSYTSYPSRHMSSSLLDTPRTTLLSSLLMGTWSHSGDSSFVALRHHSYH